MILPPIVLTAYQEDPQQQVLKKAFERMLFASRFEKTIDLSDLNITQQQVKNIYTWIINNLTPLYSFLDMPKTNPPQNFFQMENGKWNGKISIRPKPLIIESLKKNADQLANQLTKILTYLPKTYNVNDYIYWMYSFISNWIKYVGSGNSDINNLVGTLINKQGLCESYSRTSQLFFNIFGIESIYQTGLLKSGEAAGSHVWNKFKINNQWFNFDTTSAATAKKAYYLLPVGDYLSFNDKDFSSKREQFISWYESPKVADFNTASLAKLVPYRHDLPYKKNVYNNKWYYFDFNSREIIESNIDGSDRTVIRKVNRAANDNNKQVDIVYLVGDKLYWVDVNEENKIVISEFDLQTRQTNLNYHVFDFPVGTTVTSTKLNNLNELSVTISYDGMTNSEIIKMNGSYNFFENNKTKFLIRGLASILSLWFTQFEIGSNIGQFKNEELYFKYQDILIKGLTTTNYNESLYNQLLNFKQSVENDLNKVVVPIFDIEIDTSKSINEYDNLVIKPTVTIENATNPEITYQWQQSSNGDDWTNIEGQTNEDLTINNITKEWNNKKVKVIMWVNNNGENHEINSNECIITIDDPILPTINLNYSPNKTEWDVNDSITFNFNFSSNNNLRNIKLYKKQEQTITEIATIISDQNTANYIVKRDDLEKNIEFYIEADYFDRKVKSNVLTINFTPKFTQSINDENKTEINELDIDSEFTLSVNGGADGLTYQWNYDGNYFKFISSSETFNSIRLKVIKNDNKSQVITCNIRRNGSNIKIVSYTITFKNNSNIPVIPDPEKPENPTNPSVKSNNLPIIIGSVSGVLILIVVIITIIVVIKKRKK